MIPKRICLIHRKSVKFFYLQHEHLSSETTFPFPKETFSEILVELQKRLLNFSSSKTCQSRHPLIRMPIIQKRILIEYGSPNIAKPLHAGHLRSAVIGNALSNLYLTAGHCVNRVNYIGDCGTQFAVIGSSLNETDIKKLLQANTEEHSKIVKWLLEKYVSQSSKMMLESSNSQSGNCGETLKYKINLWHKNFESQDESIRKIWRTIRTLSLKELSTMYNRLGVTYDSVQFESEFVEDAKKLCQDLLIRKYSSPKYFASRPENTFGCIVNLEISSIKDPEQGRSRIFLKSDGSSVYLSRDVAALLCRTDPCNSANGTPYDHIHYVVENGQTEHLEALRKIVCLLKPERGEMVFPETFHVKFGRVHGMSTRKGSVVLLSDILDEAKFKMTQILLEKSTTRIDKGDMNLVSEVADKLGVTAVVVNDLKRRRQKDYSFSWKNALDFSPDGGISMQYAHARLCSIESQAGFSLENRDTTLNFANLYNSSAVCKLVAHMLQFGDTVDHCLETLEPVHFVRYTLRLARLANQCVEDPSLRVKDQDLEVALPPLVLFKCTRNLLASCLHIIGLPALSNL